MLIYMCVYVCVFIVRDKRKRNKYQTFIFFDVISHQISLVYLIKLFASSSVRNIQQSRTSTPKPPHAPTFFQNLIFCLFLLICYAALSLHMSLTWGHTYPRYLNQHTLLMERTCFLSSLCVGLFIVQSYIASLAFATVPNITTD
jgi:hypothetical protein